VSITVEQILMETDYSEGRVQTTQ